MFILDETLDYNHLSEATDYSEIFNEFLEFSTLLSGVTVANCQMSLTEAGGDTVQKVFNMVKQVIAKGCSIILKIISNMANIFKDTFVSTIKAPNGLRFYEGLVQYSFAMLQLAQYLVTTLKEISKDPTKGDLKAITSECTLRVRFISDIRNKTLTARIGNPLLVRRNEILRCFDKVGENIKRTNALINDSSLEECLKANTPEVSLIKQQLTTVVPQAVQEAISVMQQAYRTLHISTKGYDDTINPVVK